MYHTNFYIAFCLILNVISSPVNTSGTDNTAQPLSHGKSITGGRKLQATVTGYGVCLTQGMACGLTGSPGKDPTAAMSAYLIPKYGQGNCGTCWKLSNPRKLNYHSTGVPKIGGPLNSPKGDGMVVMVNNACAPGKNQYGPSEIGQCTQNTTHPMDKLGSQTVLDLCTETDAVEMMWGASKAGLAVADIEEVDCSEWSGHIRHV